MSHWLYNGKLLTEVPEDAFGFIYRITEKSTKQKYIGRKYFYNTRRVKQKNKVRRKVVVKESDWRTYCGSSKVLKEKIDTRGKSGFVFEILGFAYTKGQLNYLEENIQHKLDVLTDPTYFNDAIGSKKFVGVRIDEKFIESIRTIVI